MSCIQFFLSSLLFLGAPLASSECAFIFSATDLEFSQILLFSHDRIVCNFGGQRCIEVMHLLHMLTTSANGLLRPMLSCSSILLVASEIVWSYEMETVDFQLCSNGENLFRPIKVFLSKKVRWQCSKVDQEPSTIKSNQITFISLVRSKNYYKRPR